MDSKTATGVVRQAQKIGGQGEYLLEWTRLSGEAVEVLTSRRRQAVAVKARAGFPRELECTYQTHSNSWGIFSMFWYDGVWMSTELYVSQIATKIACSCQPKWRLGGKSFVSSLADLYSCCRRAAQWWKRSMVGVWFVQFGKSMGNDLEPFFCHYVKIRDTRGCRQTDNYVPINAFYSDVIRLYLALTSLDFRKRHPIETLELVPDVMALLNTT